jgi:hypothetical protein
MIKSMLNNFQTYSSRFFEIIWARTYVRDIMISRSEHVWPLLYDKYG